MAFCSSVVTWSGFLIEAFLRGAWGCHRGELLRHPHGVERGQARVVESAPYGCARRLRAEHDQNRLLADRVDHSGAALFTGNHQQAGRGAQARGQIVRVGGIRNQDRHRRAMEHGDMDDFDQ